MMVLSRKANDQNRTILVIYSNHRPTSFGIITKTAEEIFRYFLRCVIRQTRLFQMLFYIDLEQFAVSVNLDAVGLGGYHDQIER